MPYDDSGNYFSDISEYLQRKKVQDALAGPNTTAIDNSIPARAPSDSIGVSAPSSLSPATQNYESLVKQAPLHQDYHPSKLRSVLSTIAGIGTGIIGGPSLGEHVYNEARDAPYNRKMSDYQQRLGQAKTFADTESNSVAAQGKLSLEEAQRKAEVERAGAEASRRRLQEFDMSPTAHQYKMEELGVSHPGKNEDGPYEIKLKDGTIVHNALRDPSSGMFKNPEDGSLFHNDAIDQISEKGKSIKGSSSFTGVLAEDVRAHQVVAEDAGNPGSVDPATLEAAKAYIKNREQGKDPTSSFASVVAAKETEIGRKLTSAELTKITKDLQPEQKPPQTLMIGPDNKAINVKPGVAVPEGSRTTSGVNTMNTPTAATRGRGEAATTAINAGNDIIKFAGANKDKLGHLENYWQSFVSGTPIADPTLATFQGKVASWAAFQAAAHGFRASTVMREFEDRVGKGPKNVDAVIGVIQGINDELQQAVNTGAGGSSSPASNGPVRNFNPTTGRLE